ncbi:MULTISPECIES: hypothetical protein [unclassified Streptomyces]|uniref:hypothetical protein n=1 Tax=unclassified Streptomyces TaxID=2593676 RepID=UPI002DD9A256|nr:hypothetical protein [Streptomyces sp. NBC_00243]WRZ21566.1 hypothetical protein OHT59_25310 [Streptomyces sp. NBC_00243]
MIQWEVGLAVAEFILVLVTQVKFGLVCALLLPLIFIGIRKGHSSLATGAAVVFIILLSQA